MAKLTIRQIKHNEKIDEFSKELDKEMIKLLYKYNLSGSLGNRYSLYNALNIEYDKMLFKEK